MVNDRNLAQSYSEQDHLPLGALCSVCVACESSGVASCELRMRELQIIEN